MMICCLHVVLGAAAGVVAVCMHACMHACAASWLRLGCLAAFMHAVCSSVCRGRWSLTRALPPPAPAAAPPAEQICGSGADASTPIWGGSTQSRCLRGSGSSEESDAAGGAEGSAAVPLLAGGAAVGPPAGALAPGLRRRPGQHQELE